MLSYFGCKLSPGNAVVVKPSELSVRTSNLFIDLIPKYLDQVQYSIAYLSSCTNLLFMYM